MTNYWYISVTNTLALQIKKNTSELYSFWPTVNKLYLPMIHIRGHKGQNSTETRCRGFLVLESRCRGFLVLESRCRGFLSSEKTPWNHDVVAYLSPFLDVVAFWSWNLDVVVFWSWNLDVVVFWSWNPDVVVYVSPRPRFRFP